MTTESAAVKREPQVAIVPLNAIDIQDVASGAATFDAWLQSASGGVVTLDRIKNVAGALPVVGNIMALVDALGDIVTLSNAQKRDLLAWASLGINLIGVLPLPPAMAAARMTLRPTLFLVRQEMRASSKMLISSSVIEILIGHLNESIIGTLDDFVDQAKGKLPGILADAGKLGEDVINEIAKGLDTVANGKLDAKGDAQAASQKISAAGNQLLNDPLAAIDNIFGAAASAYKAAGKGLANSAADHLLPDDVKKRVATETAKLRAMGPELRTQLSKLDDESVQNSIGWLLLILSSAVTLWRKRNAHGQSAAVHTEKTNQATHTASEGQLGVNQKQAPAKGAPNPKKGPCECATDFSINFALGSESLSHTDFSLPGPFPIEWTRTYNSRLDAYDQGELGARWISEFTTRFDCVDDGLTFYGADGRDHSYPLPKVGLFHYDTIENITLVRASEDQLLLCHGFERKETYVRRGQRFVLTNISLRNGAGIMLHYEHRHCEQSVLSDLITYQENDFTKVHLHLGTMIDGHGRLTGLWEIRDGEPQRQLCAYQYDACGDLIQAQDENGAVWSYQYKHHLITRYTDRTGRGMNLEWQGTGAHAKAVREWADDGSFDTRLEWDENIRLTYVTDAHGNETWHYYDILGYTYRIRQADGLSEWLFRDEAKNVVRHVHPDGTTDRYSYDERSNLIEHIRADNTVVHFAYDDHDQVIKIMDAEGGLWLRAYDDVGNLIETTDPLGNKTEYAYNKAGQPTAIKDANGNEKTLDYNDAGQLVEYVDCSGKASAWEYDERGQMICFTDAAGSATEYEYTAGQVVLIKHPDKTEEHFERDAEGRLLTHVDGLDRCTTWSYTAAGFIAERVDAAEQTLRYRWDRLGRLQALENENDRSAQFQYDPMGRLLAETGFDSRITRYQYEPETGRLASIINGDRVIGISLDEMGRVTERRASKEEMSQTETFAYDGNGNLILAGNTDSRVQWFHDPAGNLVREHQHYLGLEKPLVAVWQHEYDVLNQRIATTRPDGHRVSWLTYGSGHLLALRLNEHELLGYERDDMHREVVRHQGNRLVQTQKWDPVGRLQEQLLGRSDDKSVLLKREYTYDGAGQLTDINDSRRGSLSYRYDPVGRLLSAASRLGVETFDFDPAGNLLDERAAESRRPLELTPPRSKLLDNLLREFAGTHYEYDDRGNQVKRWHSGANCEMRWDLFDRLVHFNDARLSVEYAYDALGRRLFKHSNVHYKQRPEAGSLWNRNEHARAQREHGCGFTLYGWDGDNLAWESSLAQKDGEAGKTVHYFFEPGTFNPVAQALTHSAIKLMGLPSYDEDYSLDQDPLWNHSPVSPPVDVLTWYQCDHLGTPQELTDQNGEVAWSAQYKAWGEVREQRSEWARQQGIANPIRFQGQYHDHETGLHYNRHRYYDPANGRFVSQDPIGFAGGLNLYAYAPNPVNWIDPLGLAKSGRWEPVGNGRIRIDPPHVENTNQQVHAHCQCKSRKAEVVVNKDGSQSHGTRGSVSELTRKEKDYLREQGFNL
ncbi:RHS repeat-associated core domain-containing protein [Pseudomonas sp. 10S4]|uniref:RHS repeat-associated core domain-containing protein n=1 Tax=Pseudomonas sp. 10S4 TaxID=3048583 RepID=UPI002B23A6B8|nr:MULTISPECIES: RHS repeat-associated core domain-containing protein [unclassified Pseudomonas]MEB0223002.1 RHS repeat-associated core domain-containing protein [Pseudomonas sp. 5S1]MEB0293592.1 RHS repeat-associated core domain-containing protein [Pseudomonas sp. 10S4]